ncbi:Z-ring formation inhibitor MciZ [Paenibacillus yonginensis]|nr:Z-ring formation inhibitor MciZ [Paenibacillus yonginensis]
MKSYWSEDQIRLSGKAWQIRHFLKRWQREAEPGMLLKDWIGQTGKQRR